MNECFVKVDFTGRAATQISSIHQSFHKSWLLTSTVTLSSPESLLCNEWVFTAPCNPWGRSFHEGISGSPNIFRRRLWYRHLLSFAGWLFQGEFRRGLTATVVCYAIHISFTELSWFALTLMAQAANLLDNTVFQSYWCKTHKTHYDHCTFSIACTAQFSSNQCARTKLCLELWG